MSGMYPIRPCPIDLSFTAITEGIKQYKDMFNEAPNLLIVHDLSYLTAEEIIHHYFPRHERVRLMSVYWIPHDAWMLTRGSMGIIYSEGV